MKNLTPAPDRFFADIRGIPEFEKRYAVRSESGFLPEIPIAFELSVLSNQETPPCLPLSGEELRDTAVSCPSPDKGRLGGVSSDDVGNRILICRWYASFQKGYAVRSLFGLGVSA